MAFPVAPLVAALRRSGLLLSTASLPEGATDITDDSRAVTPGSVFVAVRGSAQDGHDYLPDAERRGAAVAIVEDAARTTLPSIVVREGRRAVAIAAAAAFGDPGLGLDLVAVTGTNGKTTTVNILRHLFDAPDAPSASIGTLGVLLRSAGDPAPGGGGLTTPGPVEMQRVLRSLADAHVRRVAIEVSSHSLDQHRVEGLAFAAAIFTNLTRDHLDYHRTMESYRDAKLRLVEHLAPGAPAVINADDPAWAELARRPGRVTFGVDTPADVTAADVRYSSTGSEWHLTQGGAKARVRLPLLGAFNVANALGAAAAAIAVGGRLDHVAERLSTIPQVPGRLEVLSAAPPILRDYAHTPDALERALGALRPVVRGKLIVVFGCGGDRDPGKRPLMGAVAERLADHAILTSDNPRTENPEKILDDIEAGMRARTHDRIEDRRAAIRRAIDLARDGDAVLLAGKGHEDYQIRGTTKLPFDERVIVTELLAEATH